MEKLIGRIQEKRELQEALDSPRSEFVILYGRRRIGKTFLVRNFFSDRYDFHFVGMHHQPQTQQLERFRKALLREASNKDIPTPGNWQEAFDMLETYLEHLPSSAKKVLFFDEMPWIDSKRSDFVSALEYFWNSWVSGRDDILLLACGSASSWMKDKLIDNRGGLHNRITRQIYLRPFNLAECETYLHEHGFDWDRYQVIQCYMILGGVPFYLSLLHSTMSLPENIDALFYVRNGQLRDEFDELYSAVYTNADTYMKIVKALAHRHQGMTRSEIEKDVQISGGSLTRMLKNLERCDFITCYAQLGNRTKNKVYLASDFFTLFYIHFIESEHSRDEHFWSHHFMDRSIEVWQGLTFEIVCLMHLTQLKQALGISGIATAASTWRYVPPKDAENRDLPTEGAQIDLVIERADKMTHLCEMKFSDKEYLITKDYEAELRRKQSIFSRVTGQHGLLTTLITPYGLQPGKYSHTAPCEITADALFQ